MSVSSDPRPYPTPERRELSLDGRCLSYLDFGGVGRPLLAVHGHFLDGSCFTDLARELAPEWRVIAPDQRGHGASDRAADYSREGYVADLVALLDHLGLSSVVVLGHSMGGKNTYQLAARHPERVSAFVCVDDAVAIPLDAPNGCAFSLAWPLSAPTREAMLDALGFAAPLLGDGLREIRGGGWGLPFVPEDMVASDEAVHGDYWADWLGSTCPALLVHGLRSQVLATEMAREMAARRPRTRLVELDTDHFIPQHDPKGFAAAVREFLDGLPGTV
ncbi:alpha/beta hydrolase [Streptomyces sp. NPDC003077]|uniref:alpha/beta fold hydrolase n=1 Tax=Streptomyces sp. NPDC003077 TaxID=3154443 RepID=UPI0033BF69C5